MSISVQGTGELREIFTSIRKLNHVRGAVKLAGTHLKFALMQQPPQAAGRKIEFKSDKQQRYFFWALKQGQITVPYRRGSSPGSRNLKQTWTVTTENDGMTVIVGNNTPYGPLVQGEQRQTQYHRYTGWKTTAQVEKEERELIMDLLERALAADIG